MEIRLKLITEEEVAALNSKVIYDLTGKIDRSWNICWHRRGRAVVALVVSGLIYRASGAVRCCLRTRSGT